MTAYYNEHDPNAAQWLRELIKLGQIAPGEVDERSIVDVQAVELKSFSQIHLFAGIGVWSYALRQAGWDDDRPVITGSCPCQSFSVAGKQRGFDDERHLWGEMFKIIKELGIKVVFGEQVASKGALAWWDLVADDLEREDYATTAFDLPGASIGAPHLRHRLFWVADSSESQRQKWSESERICEEQPRSDLPSGMVKLANSQSLGRVGRRFPENSDDELERRETIKRCESGRESERFCETDKLVNSSRNRSAWNESTVSQEGDAEAKWCGTTKSAEYPPTFWDDDAIWLPCLDRKYRTTKSSIKPLVNGAASRVGFSGDISLSDTENTSEARIMRLKGYGNAIVAPLAVEFISAYLDCES